MMKGKELAEPAVEKFHAQYNEGKYTEIRDQADDEFKKIVTEEQLVELLSAVQRKLGKVKSATNSGLHVNTTTSGTFATVTYNVEFAEGKGTEQFVFHIMDDKALLYNFNVNSPLLITK